MFSVPRAARAAQNCLPANQLAQHPDLTQAGALCPSTQESPPSFLCPSSCTLTATFTRWRGTLTGLGQLEALLRPR